VGRAAAGDRDAQREIFDSQRSTLNRLARERADRGLPREDLLQEGSLGLLGAIRDFSGGDFDRLAEERAAAAMDAALSSDAAARERDEQMVRDANEFATAEIRLRRELGRAPRAGELAEHLEWSVDRVEEVAGAVADARERHDEDLLAYLDPDDMLELLDGEDDGA
jgi:DNA-directed RNA polymerase specialized sigma subunit